MNNLIFKEKTSLPKFIFIIFIIQFFVFIIYYLNNLEDKSLLYIIITITFIGVLLILTKLNLKIDNHSIEYKFFPFMLNQKKIKWSEIESFKINKVSAISNFMGWGLRYSKKYGWGYITNTDKAIFIKTKEGKKIVISIENVTKLKELLTIEKIKFNLD